MSREGTMFMIRPENRCGVYAIINPLTKKAYIGESIDLYRRFAEHTRSILGPEDSTNENVKDESVKAFILMPVVFGDYSKDQAESYESAKWIVHETTVMYVFRKHGFCLYNGDHSYRDNIGKRRSFLLNDKIELDNLKELFYTYLKEEKASEAIYKEYGCKDWDEFINKIEEEINQDLDKYFGVKSIDSLIDNFATCTYDEWNNYAKRIAKNLYKVDERNKNKIFVVDEANARKICNKFLCFHLSTADLKRCGIKGMTLNELEELIDCGDLDRIVVSKFGHYLDQSPMTILSTKKMDIERTRISPLNLKEIDDCFSGCFWALKRLELDHTRRFLLEGEDKHTAKYAILAYTPSKVYKTSVKYDKEKQFKYKSELNPKDGESLEAFFSRINALYETDLDLTSEKFVYGYAFDEKNRRNKTGRQYAYPRSMFPAIVSKTEKNNALLISDLKYAEVRCTDFKELFNLYESYPASPRSKEEKDKSLAKTLKGSTSHACAAIKESRDMLKKYFKSNSFGSDNDEVSFLLAKLEYPYIIPLVNNEIK